MGKTFQDQLLKSGLVNKQQLNESKSSKHKQNKQNKKKKGHSVNQQKNALTEQQLEQQNKDLELNRQLQSQRAKKAVESEIKQIIITNKISFDDGDIAYKFSDQGTVRQIYVPTKVQKDLATDRLQIVRYENGYVVIPSAIAATILQRDPDYGVIKTGSVEAEDESYADYKVPDDLIW